MRRFLIILLYLCACAVPPQAAAQENPLHVGLTDDYPPLSYTDAQGRRAGFEYELAQALCRRLGRPCSWTFAPQEQLLRGLKDGRLDMIFAQRLEPEQAGLLYSRPYYHSRAMCVGRPGGRGPGDAGARVGVYRGSALEQYAAAAWPGAVIVSGSVGEMIAKLQRGEIDVLFINDIAGYAFLLRPEGQEFDRLEEVPTFTVQRTGGSRVAVGEGRERLLKAVDRELKRLLYSGELHNLSRIYFHYIIY